MAESSETLGEAQTTALTTALEGAAEHIATIKAETAKLAALRSRVENAAQKITDYRNAALDIERAPATVSSRLGSQFDLATLESEIRVVESQKAGWVKERSEAMAQLASAAQTAEALSKRIEALSSTSVTSASESLSDSLEAKINELVATAAAKAKQVELERLQIELRNAPTLNNVLNARINWLDSAIADADNYLSQLRTAAADLRDSAVEQRRAAIRRALSELDTVPTDVEALGRDTRALLQTLSNLSEQIELEREHLTETQELASRIEQDATLTRRRLEVAGLESKFGEVMLSRLASLPDSRDIRARASRQSDQIAAVSIDAIDSEQAIRELPDISTYIEQYADDAQTERQAVAQIYAIHRELLVEVLDARNVLLRMLVDNNQATESLAAAAADYEEMLTAQLLWVRSYGFLDLEALRDKVENLLAGKTWVLLGKRIHRVGQDPVALLTALLLIALLTRRRSIRGYLNENLGRPIRPREENAGLLLRTLTASALRVLPTPLFLLLGARVMTICADGDSALLGLHRALLVTGTVLFLWRFFEILSDRLGVGRRLLKWNSQKFEALTFDMGWTRAIFVITVFVTVFANALSPTDSGGLVGAGGSFLLTILLVFLLLRLLRRENFSIDGRGTFLARAALVVAVAIGIMHLTGQLFAAHLYLTALLRSLIAVVLILLLISVLQRLLINYRSRLNRQRREEVKGQEDSEADVPTALSEGDHALDAAESLSAAYDQLLYLLRVVATIASLWVIWSPALPALNVFDAVTLWTTTDLSMEGQLRSITLSTLLVAIAVIVATLLTTRHLPPILNVALIEWTSISPGVRYASGMLMQYLIIGVGFSIALMLLGFQWEKVQWLVAALGVGIGFGLQEIVANFISGLIVLFERPIRVGDIINAGAADGVVTRINPRATVIETFDGKEVMVPNKDLITNVVTNWSLSSSKLRTVISVGVAYGSDVAYAARLLKQVADEHAEILNDPAPMVTFEEFGDNALTLWLRCYTLKDYPRVASELRHNIYKLLNEEGISIAFPQRDVHLDVGAAIPVEIVSANRSEDR
ncbi:MAG: hypothetical protein Cons2KO_05740 [Congregibacter sp.]